MIFPDSLPDAKAFFAPLTLPLSTLTTLIRFFVACFNGLHAAADAADAIRIEPRHRAQLVRFLARQGWSRNWNTLTAIAELLLQHCYDEKGTWVLLLDQTHHTTFGKRAQNTFSRANRKARAKKSQRRQKKTHTHACHCFIFGLLISPQTGTRIPLVRSYYTKDYCRQRAATATARHPAPTFRTQADLAAEIIRCVRVPAGCPLLVLGDTAFEAKQIRAACKQRGFDWITPANPERVLAGTKDRQKLRSYCTQVHHESATAVVLNPGQGDWGPQQRVSRSKAGKERYARRYWTHTETLAVHNVGTVQVVFSTTHRPQPGRPAGVQKILLSNRSDWDAQQVVAAYAVRWQIELFFKEMKSDLGMSSYRVGPFEEVEGWIQVCCLAFCYLEWYRLRRREQFPAQAWGRLRSRRLIEQVRQESEWLDLEQIARAMQTPEERERLRARLQRALPWELRQSA